MVPSKCHGIACQQRLLYNAAKTYVTDERMQSVSRRAIESTKNNMSSSSSKCNVCYLQKTCCICSRLTELKKSLPQQRLKCHVCLFTHYKEYGKASNTGKLLQIAFPGCVSTFIFGNAADDARLANKLAHENTFVLYPGKKSIPLRSVLDALNAENVDQNVKVSERNTSLVNLVVVDSTWTQSKAMYRWLSSLRLPSTLSAALQQQQQHQQSSFCFHVNVNSAVEDFGPSGYLNRRQVFPSKSSTIESVAYALAALESPRGLWTGEAVEAHVETKMANALLDYCSRALELSVQGNLVQSGKMKRADGNDTSPAVCPPS